MSDATAPRGPGVAVTRPGPDPGRLGALLSAAGATVVHWPCIRFVPPADPGPLEDAVRALATYDWVVLTSPRAARRWSAACRDLGVAPTGSGAGAGAVSGSAVRSAAVGPATAAALREAGWPVSRVAATYSAAGLVETFAAAGDARGARVLVPSSALADDVLPEALRELGAEVDRVISYRTLPAARSGATGGVRVVTFTSPSTVEGFLAVAKGDEALAAAIRRRFATAAIGPTTAGALAAAGWPSVVAEEATLEALAEAAMRAARDPTRREDTT